MTATPPEWLPAVGTTVYLKVVGSSRKPVGYEIMGYKEFAPGEWVFKATGPRGIRITDNIDVLL